MTTSSFLDLTQLDFISLYGALVRPRLEYGIPASLPNILVDIKHLERNQRLTTRLATGIRHLPNEEKL